MAINTSIIEPHTTEVALPGADNQIPDRWVKFGQVIWLAIMLLTMGIFIGSLPENYKLLQTVCANTSCDTQLSSAQYQDLLSHGFSLRFYANLITTIIILCAFFFLGIASILYFRKSGNWIGLLGSISLVSFGLVTLSSNPTAVAALPQLLILIGTFLDYLGITSIILFLYIFPDGRITPRWTIIPIILMSILLIPEFFIPGSPRALRSWGWKHMDFFQLVEWLVILGPLVFVQSYRYRKVYSPAQRQQTKWVVYALVTTISGFLVLSLIPILFPSLVQDVWVFILSIAAIYLLMLIVPVSIGIAILRHGLWDIDLIINRTLVYVPLTGILAGLYTSSITLFQRIFISTTGQKSDAAIVISTLILASTFTPIKNGFQGVVDKRFKEPDNLYNELKVLGNQVRMVVEVLTIRNIVVRLLSASISAFQANSGAVFLQEDGNWVLIHSTSNWKDEDGKLSFPIEFEGKQLAMLKLGPREKEAPYGSKEYQVLKEVSHQIAQAIQLVGH